MPARPYVSDRREQLTVLAVWGLLSITNAEDPETRIGWA